MFLKILTGIVKSVHKIRYTHTVHTCIPVYIYATGKHNKLL